MTWSSTTSDARACGLVQQHPVPADLGALYSDYPIHAGKSGLHEWFRRVVLKDVYFDPRGLPAGSRLLDFGCGDGWFLDATKKAGVTCEGYEFQPDHAGRLSAHLGVRVFGDFDRLVQERQGAYDAITLHNVLEHVADPGSTIQALDGPARAGRIALYRRAQRRVLGGPVVRASLARPRSAATHQLSHPVRHAQLCEQCWPAARGHSSRCLSEHVGRKSRVSRCRPLSPCAVPDRAARRHVDVTTGPVGQHVVCVAQTRCEGTDATFRISMRHSTS